MLECIYDPQIKVLFVRQEYPMGLPINSAQVSLQVWICH